MGWKWEKVQTSGVIWGDKTEPKKPHAVVVEVDTPEEAAAVEALLEAHAPKG